MPSTSTSRTDRGRRPAPSGRRAELLGPRGVDHQLERPQVAAEPPGADPRLVHADRAGSSRTTGSWASRRCTAALAARTTTAADLGLRPSVTAGRIRRAEGQWAEGAHQLGRGIGLAGAGGPQVIDHEGEERRPARLAAPRPRPRGTGRRSARPRAPRPRRRTPHRAARPPPSRSSTRWRRVTQAGDRLQGALAQHAAAAPPGTSAGTALGRPASTETSVRLARRPLPGYAAPSPSSGPAIAALTECGGAP